ncbi:MAG TPA: hypothetical protein VHZ05_13695 [Acidimicrobiales bacterium]|nr:hypothetical protein [Acidimicrobiales bacterium]
MGRKGKRPRTPSKKLPPVPDYVRYTGGGRRYWRLGGPLTRTHEKEALTAQRSRPPGRVGRLVLRVLGQKPEPPSA